MDGSDLFDLGNNFQNCSVDTFPLFQIFHFLIIIKEICADKANCKNEYYNKTFSLVILYSSKFSWLLIVIVIGVRVLECTEISL